MTRGTATRAVLVALVAVGVTGWLAVGATLAFSQPRHREAARATLTAADVVTREFRPDPGSRLSGARGRLQLRPGSWLSVVSLEGMPPLRDQDRYLVFLHNREGWVLAGTTRPGPDGRAQVRFAGDPAAFAVNEAMVTRGVDTARSNPHGVPLLYWIDPAALNRGLIPFDISREPPSERR